MTTLGLRVRRWCARCGVLTDAGWRCVADVADIVKRDGSVVRGSIWRHAGCNGWVVIVK